MARAVSEVHVLCENCQKEFPLKMLIALAQTYQFTVHCLESSSASYSHDAKTVHQHHIASSLIDKPIDEQYLEDLQ